MITFIEYKFIEYKEDGRPNLTQQGAVLIILIGIILGTAISSCSEYMLNRRAHKNKGNLRAE
jgi:uncharacterized membrane protein YwzB